MFQFFIIKMFKHLQRLLNFARNAGAGFSPFRRNKKSRRNGMFLLLCQGSNLNFSDPESDVLPITPQSSLEAANINKN